MKFNGQNVTISKYAKIGNNVKIGDNVTVYDSVEIGDNTIVCNDSVIGEPLNSYYYDSQYKNPKTIIGADSLIRSHTIVYAGCNIGIGLNTGHRTTIRENTIIGNSCSIGTMSDVQADVKIGNYCRIHSLVHIGQYCSMGDFVFVYPYCVMTNDPYPPSNVVKGGYIGDYTQVAVHSIIMPGVKIGRHCLIGANSVVTRKMPDYSFVKGSPAKIIEDTRKIKAITKEKLYPWPPRFSRGMPWQNIGYEKWLNINDKDKL